MPDVSLDELSQAMRNHVESSMKRMAEEGPRENPMTRDRTRLSFWFPQIEVAGLPVPKTNIVTLPLLMHRDMMEPLLNRGERSKAMELLEQLIRSAAASIVGEGNPFFLRTDHTSGKHDWKDTCFVQDWSRIPSHISNIICYSEMAGGGLPTQTWVIREMLPVKPMFHAFEGMPIVREYRLFMNNGELLHMQPYWPNDAIKGKELPADWNDRLNGSHQITQSEVDLLVDLARKANAACPGFWSIDFLETDRGWFLTDMAEGQMSYKWDCHVSLPKPTLIKPAVSPTIEVVVSPIVVHDGKMLVYERLTSHAGRLAIPGGKVEFGEDLETAAIRELKEETGIECDYLEFLDVITDVHPDLGKHYLIVYFRALGCTNEPTNPEPTKMKGPQWVGVEIMSQTPIMRSMEILFENHNYQAFSHESYI